MVIVAMALCAPLLAPFSPSNTPAVAAPVLGVPTSVAAPLDAGSVAIRADAIWLGDGRVVEKGTLLLSDGRIADVGTNVSVPSGTQVIELKGTITAGLIALHGYSGAPNEMVDGTRPSMPESKLRFAFDPSHYDFEDARKSGITTIVLTPPAEGVAPGITAVVKTAGGTMLSDAAHLSLVFTADGLVSNRKPTSIAGAMAMMEEMFAQPRGSVALAAEGKLPCLFETTTKPDIQRAIDFAGRHKLTGAIHGAALAGELAESIHDAKLSVIVPVIEIGKERRALVSVAELAKKDVRFGFGLDSPWNHPSELRLGAAMCVREGLDSAKAWSALTSDAARIAGVDARVGRIDRGLDADVVLWSGNPLDLGSRIVAVYVDGVRVVGGDR